MIIHFVQQHFCQTTLQLKPAQLSRTLDDLAQFLAGHRSHQFLMVGDRGGEMVMQRAFAIKICSHRQHNDDFSSRYSRRINQVIDKRFPMIFRCVDLRKVRERTAGSGLCRVVGIQSENLFELNEVYRIGMNSGDLGGFYGYCGFTGFGNVMRNNFVHHSMNGNAFYMDDGTSGATVTGNVAYKCAMGVLMGGGHYNHFDHNIIIDCTKGIHIDDRGVSRKYTLEDTRLGGDVRSVSPDQSPWKEKHPELAALVAGLETTIPKGDSVIGNVLINCTTPIELPKPENAGGVEQKGNVTEGSLAEFTDADNFDFSLKPGSTLVAAIEGFPPIPFQQIGLQIDEYRKSIPTRDMKLLKEGDTTKRKFSSTTDIEASNKK